MKMSEGSVQEATMAASPHDTEQTISNDTYPLDTASVFPLAELPMDIRRMVYDYLPEPTFRPLLKSETGRSLYFETLRIPQGLMQANKFLHEEMVACFEPVTINRPIAVLWLGGKSPSDMCTFFRYACAVLKLLGIGRSYDSLNQSKGEVRFRGSVDYLQREHEDVIHTDGAAVEVFLRYALARLRRQPGSIIDIRALVSQARMDGPCGSSIRPQTYENPYGLDARYTLALLKKLSIVQKDSYGQIKEIRPKLRKSERELLDQIQREEKTSS